MLYIYLLGLKTRRSNLVLRVCPLSGERSKWGVHDGRLGELSDWPVEQTDLIRAKYQANENYAAGCQLDFKYIDCLLIVYCKWNIYWILILIAPCCVNMLCK